MKRILAAVDLSKVTDEVLKRAASMAQALSARLILLHVAGPDPDFVGYEAGPQSVRDTRAHELRGEHRRFQRRAEQLRGAGIDAEAYMVQGPTVDTIVERAEHFEVDMIVLGSHGHGALYHALLGSVSVGVLRRATVPVLIIPARLASPENVF